MSRNAKIALILVGSLLVICLGLCVVGFLVLPRITESVVATNPGSAGNVGAEIADYTLPPGYQEQMGMNLLIYQLVVLAPESGPNDGMVIMLMGTRTPGVSRAQMEQQMQQSFQQQFNRSTGGMRVVGEEHFMIRGEDTTFTITESENPPRFRQAVGTFEGKNGLVVMMMMGSADQWDTELMRNFISSIQ